MLGNPVIWGKMGELTENPPVTLFMLLQLYCAPCWDGCGKGLGDACGAACDSSWVLGASTSRAGDLSAGSHGRNLARFCSPLMMPSNLNPSELAW